MTLTIDWNTLSTDAWEDRFARLPHSNILQSYTYARAYCPLEKQRARWGLIRIDGKEAGLVQIFEAGILRNLFHAVILDRGPLWFEGYGHAMHSKWFFNELNRQFEPRFGRKRRILPEIEDGPAAQKLLEQIGLVRAGKGYETIWLDLTPDLETLRANLKSNWRNKLNKAEKADVSVASDYNSDALSWILGIYAGDKAARDYGGPSPDFLRAYLPLLAQRSDLILLRTMKNGTPVAFTVLACHGRSATYLIGWSSDEGREVAAHQHLLWEGVKMLQHKGIKELDLGGINDDGAEGIKTFKEGLGGRTVRFVGLYS